MMRSKLFGVLSIVMALAVGGAAAADAPAAKKVASVQEIANGLKLAMSRSPEAYSLYLMSIWDPNGVKSTHEPPTKNDGPMTLATFVSHQIGQDVGLSTLGKDYRYEATSMKVEGNVIAVSFKMAITPTKGEAVALPLNMRYVVRDGVLREWIVNNEHYAGEEMKKLQAARAAQAEGAGH